MFPKRAWYFIIVLVIHCPKCALHCHFCKKSTITPNFLHYIIEHLWYCNPNHPWVFSACVKALGGLYRVYLWNRESSRITPNLPSSNSLYTQIFLVATIFFSKNTYEKSWIWTLQREIFCVPCYDVWYQHCSEQS